MGFHQPTAPHLAFDFSGLSGPGHLKGQCEDKDGGRGQPREALLDTRESSQGPRARKLETGSLTPPIRHRVLEFV